MSAPVVSIPWWAPLLSGLIGVLVGFGLNELRERSRRKRERHGHFEALAAELQICAEMARGYINGGVKAPAYRMPMIAYARSIPALLADGVLRFEESSALFRFYVGAQSFNFALDQAQAVLMKRPDDRPEKRLDLEVGRAQLKARKLAKDSEKPNHYDGAIAVVRAHLPQKSHGRLSIEEDDLREPT